jgi:hypothetical protein
MSMSQRFDDADPEVAVLVLSGCGGTSVIDPLAAGILTPQRRPRAAGSNTCCFTKSSTARPSFGRSGSIKSNMNFDDPSLPSCTNRWVDR